MFTILWGNEPTQITLDWLSAPAIRYSAIAGGWPGEGNLDADPLFARRGCWADRDNPDMPRDPDTPNAVRVQDDYHPQSQVGRWDPDVSKWVLDEATSPCIDAGDPTMPTGREPAPDGGIVNLGAYGGTTEAGKSGN